MPPETKAAIVVIDGDVERITPNLARHGYSVHSAATVQQGLDLVSETTPELILLDYQLAGADTPAVLGEIRNRFPTSYAVISLPRCAANRTVQLIGNGAVECVLMPCGGNELLSRLDTALRIRELELRNGQLQLEMERLAPRPETCPPNYQQLLREKAEALHRAHFEITHTEKMAAMGFLAADMAHDIRNPLNSISLFTQLMRQHVTDPDQKEYLGKIIKEVERIDFIIRRLLEISRCKRNVATEVRIDRIIDGALEVFSPRIEAASIRLERRYEVETPPIKADPDELEQIFTNLFLNALDEMPGGGRLGIDINVEEGAVVVRVEDSGGGIPEYVLPNIFEPFFTTKPRGTGMGLPVVKRLARLHGGTITVEKSSSEGTVLRLEFPTFSHPNQPGPTPGEQG